MGPLRRELPHRSCGRSGRRVRLPSHLSYRGQNTRERIAARCNSGKFHEYIHLFSDTPVFVSNRVDFAIQRYYDQLLPPYFRELKKFSESGAYSWDAPGHMGRSRLSLKHPIGAEFHRFFGESLMRAEIGISTAALGSWLDHIGPSGESERNAARVFGADWTFYVLGGSSTSNQIVGHLEQLAKTKSGGDR